MTDDTSNAFNLIEKRQQAIDAKDYATAAVLSIELSDDAGSRGEAQPLTFALMEAQVHATLALAEQQRIANLIELQKVLAGSYQGHPPLLAPVYKKLDHPDPDVEIPKYVDGYVLQPAIAAALLIPEGKVTDAEAQS